MNVRDALLALDFLTSRPPTLNLKHMPKTKREPVKPSNVIHCVECNLDIDLLAAGGEAEFKRHCQEKHQLTEFKGTRSLLTHMDGTRWFGYDWGWEIGGKKFIQHIISPRSRADQAYWDSAEDA